MKKNFALSYLPAQLRENKSWYIEYSQLNPTTQKLERFRKTYNLNRIKSISLRRAKAKQICDYLNSIIPFGYPFVNDVDMHQGNELENTNIIEALDIAYQIKMRSDREATRKCIRSTYNIFTTWLKRENYSHFTISQFQPRHAKRYMDYAIVERDVNDNTYNNYLRNINLFFNELMRGEYIPKNPFRLITRKKPRKANRRRFTQEEKRIVANYFYENDIWMFYGILLQYYCYIRPVELTRLQKKHFDVERQLIHLPEHVIKTKNERYATIPDSIIHFFKHPRFASIPRHHYIFGPGIEPGRNQYKKNDKMYKKHKKVLHQLHAKGILENIDQLIWYSWKYTGNKDAEEEMEKTDIQKQNGHSSLKQTETYMLRDVDEVNKGAKGRTFDLL